MKIQQIKRVLSSLYSRGITDGLDIQRGSKDRFFGNTEARKRWEADILKRAYKQIKECV